MVTQIKGREMQTAETLRVAHIVEWDRSGQSCIALIRGSEVIARFSDWTAARAAYRAAIAEAR